MNTRTQDERPAVPGFAIVMAAGFGTRMKSKTPKVLHPIAGRPLLYYPVRAALDFGVEQVIVVVNPETRDPILRALSEHALADRLAFVIQEVPRGTGDAVRVGFEGLSVPDDARLLILSGDTPLITSADLAPFSDQESLTSALSLLTFSVDDPRGYGRIVRDGGRGVSRIIEDRDTQEDSQRAIREVNAGVYSVRARELRAALPALLPHNAQGELYLTDIVSEIARSQPVRGIVSSAGAFLGVNDRAELSRAAAILEERIRQRFARSGVTLIGAPLIDDTVEIGCDVTVEDGVRLRGKTKIGASSFIDVGSVITDAELGEGVFVRPYTVIEASSVGDRAILGPFSHVRPGCAIGEEAHLGNFVETKKTVLGRGTKANHLAYLGDAEIGERANIGAGTIICNYDGYSKQTTQIGARAFVGSDCQLIAPVRVGDDAYIATGTTVTEDVPDGAFAVGRSRQTTKPEYARSLRERLQGASGARAGGSPGDGK